MSWLTVGLSEDSAAFQQGILGEFDRLLNSLPGDFRPAGL